MKELLTALVYPNPILLIGLMALIFVDLISGVQKAKRAKKKKEITSSGFRRSVRKASSYFNLIVSVAIMVNLLSFADIHKEYSSTFNFSMNGLVIGCVYIEVKSILENLIAINTNKDGKQNDLCRYILVPLHNLLLLRLQAKKQELDEAKPVR